MKSIKEDRDKAYCLYPKCSYLTDARRLDKFWCDSYQYSGARSKCTSTNRAIMTRKGVEDIASEQGTCLLLVEMIGYDPVGVSTGL